MKMSFDRKSMRTGREVFQKLGLVILGFFVFYGFIQLIILLAERFMMEWIYYVGMTLYGIAIGALMVCFYVMNGFTFDGKEKTEEDLTDEWDHKQKKEYLEKLKVSRKKAKNLIYFIFPLILAIAVYYIQINFFGG